MLAKEAKREPLGSRFNPEHFVESLQCEKEILRSIDLMHHALKHIKNAEQLFSQSQTLHTFNESNLQSLNTLIKVVETDDISTRCIHASSLSALKHELQKPLLASQNELFYLDGLLFAIEMFVIHLTKLAISYGLPIIETP